MTNEILECLLSRIQVTIGVGEDVGEKAHSYVAGGLQIGAVTLERSMEIP